MNIETKNSELKAQIKFELIQYYDKIKSEIDISAQIKLVDIEKSICKDDNGEKIKKIHIYNAQFIETVDNFFNLNCQEIDDFFKNNHLIYLMDIEEIKKKALKCYVAFFSLNKLNDELLDEQIIGILISVDWYLDQNQINFLLVF
jgi:hypothetical protein